MEQKFEIKKTVAVLSGYDSYGYRKELNLVSWNDRNPKYDIRAWNKDHSVMKKGIVLNNEEMQILAKALKYLEE